uniref:Uncharacterized protein n=1 Tax=candidate division WOR-3 bacterium TaxID=2052148 RepID=A0A7V3RHD1_UNCW3
MQFLLFIFFLSPDSLLPLPGNFLNFEIAEGFIYLYESNNKKIIRMDNQNNPSAFSIDMINERINVFKLTPFFIYLGSPEGIFRLSINSGMIESIYRGYINSFTITDAEELIIADKQKKEILFLDYQNKIKWRLTGYNALDIGYYGGRIYLLTRKDIQVIDEYGNIIEKIKIPNKVEKVNVDEYIYLFKPNERVIYKWDGFWKEIFLQHPIADFKISKNNILVLNQYGDTIYFYDKSDF